MKLITRDTDYAMRALCFIARHKNDIVSVRELVKELKVPRPFLRKILQILNKKGLLNSHKGKGGGFKLALAPAGILLVDVVKVFQGPLKINECLLKKKVCSEVGACRLKKRIDAIENYVVSELKSITLTSLLK